MGFAPSVGTLVGRHIEATLAQEFPNTFIFKLKCTHARSSLVRKNAISRPASSSSRVAVRLSRSRIHAERAIPESFAAS